MPVYLSFGRRGNGKGDGSEGKAKSDSRDGFHGFAGLVRKVTTTCAELRKHGSPRNHIDDSQAINMYNRIAIEANRFEVEERRFGGDIVRFLSKRATSFERSGVQV